MMLFANISIASSKKSSYSKSGRQPPSVLRRCGRLAGVALVQVPPAVRAAIAHVLGRSETAHHLDLISSISLAVLRTAFLPIPKRWFPISEHQRMSISDSGVRGKLWVATYAAVEPPESATRDALVAAIKSLDGGGGAVQMPMPEYAPAIEAEWTGFRADARPDEPPPPDLSERAKFDALMRECHSPATVLYLHGGAACLMDPASHRPITQRLAELTGGRCYSLRYRLAPQHPFPAALLDALVSYLALLYPPPGAFHQPVRPEHVVFSGDSFGANLCLSLVQVILELRRLGRSKIQWHGKVRHLPLPAGVAAASPFIDFSLSSASFRSPVGPAFDYAPRQADLAHHILEPCAAWPASPPRRYLYADDELISHALVSPITTASWHGSPPTYVYAGWELIADDARFFARHLAAQHVPVVFEQYQAMPHVFPLIFPAVPSTRRCFEAWASFIRTVVDDPSAVESSATFIPVKTLRGEALQLEDLSEESYADVCRRVRDSVANGPALYATRQ
ncbi:hypothetical protein L249_8553 [Ophiocordyceps polyrhachis-furcata BCC 54312]|uniref:Alpha/beta hydrolase fold-3 domain-containing protein n=1 Tax=Ophiocordyceps polyrhachis-furcata BCC 54312 TaxID=1330021 RepID=A0A367L784_9HYPO|nr:hypothetical protein L249_8553 [Ophiocordyceps polyrhachis-furcata BCC 54312]